MGKLIFFLILLLQIHKMAEAIPKFRILAPEFICPKDDSTPIEKPDSTVITIQTAAGADYKFKWSVRWQPLTNPSQRFTLMLWKTIRAIEAKLNSPQPLPLLYVIENKELLEGVVYIFTVDAVESDGASGSPKTFQIDNSQGHQKLENLEGRTEMFSVMAVGADVAYSDMNIVLRAEITSCHYTQDYYFKWTVESENSEEKIDVSRVSGYRLDLPPFTFKPGLYFANCDVIRYSDGYLLTQTGLNFEVVRRGLKVYFNVDYLVISTNEPFSLEAVIKNADFVDEPVNIVWDCVHENFTCEFDNIDNNGTNLIHFPRGLTEIGSFRINVLVSVLEESASADATVVTVAPNLPVIQVSPVNRLLNEGTIVTLTANVSNIAPSCTLTWFFAHEQYLSGNNDNTDNQHGEPLSETVTIFSLQENFLNELTDYTNETEWRQVTAETQSKAGRARFVAECGCSHIFECETLGEVHADINFKMNLSPKPKDVIITPQVGIALETIFSLRTQPVLDHDPPLLYSFYCSVGVNNSILLASYLEYLTLDTFLPYVEGGTEVWIEVCDALGACSDSGIKKVVLSPGQGSTLSLVMSDIEAHGRRCEMIPLTRIVKSAVATYQNSDQQEALTKFSVSILKALSTLSSACIDEHHDAYSSLVNWLEVTGIDMSTLYN